MTVQADTAAFRAVLDTVFAQPAYQWTEEPGFVTSLRDWWRRLGGWLDSLHAANPAAFRLFTIGVLVLLVLVFAHAAYVTYRTVRGAMRPADAADEGSTAALRDAAWYRREADRAAADGRLIDALQLAFAALALTLDGQDLLRYRPSMTPAECVAAARVSDDDRRRLRGLVTTLYGFVFARRPCTADDYARWRDASLAPWQAGGASAGTDADPR